MGSEKPGDWGPACDINQEENESASGKNGRASRSLRMPASKVRQFEVEIPADDARVEEYPKG
jgi:hypothetical protein